MINSIGSWIEEIHYGSAKLTDNVNDGEVWFRDQKIWPWATGGSRGTASGLSVVSSGGVYPGQVPGAWTNRFATTNKSNPSSTSVLLVTLHFDASGHCDQVAVQRSTPDVHVGDEYSVVGITPEIIIRVLQVS